MTDRLQVLLTLLGLGVALACSTQAQPRVVETHGDGGDTTCLAAADEELWIGTRGAGMFRMTPDGSVRYDSTTGLHGNRVHDCLLLGGTVWVATEGALSRLDRETDRFELVELGRFTRLAASEHGLWASGSDGGVVRIDLEDDVRPNGAGGSPMASDLPVSALSAGPDGRWAAGGFDGRVYLGEEQRYISVEPDPALPAEPIQWLEVTGEGVLIGTAAGTHAFDGSSLTQAPQRGRRQVALGAMSKAQRAQLERLEVRDAVRFGGAVVVATDAGALLFDTGESRVLSTGAMPCGERLTALSVHAGALWVGSFDRGLCRYDGVRWEHFAGPEHLPSDMVNDMASDGERLLVATASGVTWVDAEGRFQQRTQRDCDGDSRDTCPFHAGVNGVTVDRVTGRAWVADLGAVHRADAARWKNYYRRAGIESRALTRIAAHGDVVAVGTGDRGLYLKDGRRFDGIDDQQGLSDNWVMDLAFDEGGALWVATCTQGVSVRDASGVFRVLGARDGLPDDYTLSVKPLGARIVVGTLRGLAVVAADSHAVEGVVGLADGLSGHEVHDAIEYDGRLWVATDAGLSVLQ